MSNLLPFKWNRGQYDFFHKLKSPYRLLPTGRRYGKTVGAAQDMIKQAFKSPGEPALWVDTIYRNIGRYIDREFLPRLTYVDKSLWDYSRSEKILKINGSILDFGSADRPETLEGFGYKRIYVNEAGIILKNERGRYLWYNAILPMLTDYADAVAYIFGTPKGMIDSDGKQALYYEMWEKAQDPNNPDFQGIRQSTSDNRFLTKEAIERVRKELPSGAVRDQEFDGKFVQMSAGIILAEWFRVIDEPPQGFEQVRAWDLAFSTKTSADSSAGALCSMDEYNTFTIHDLKRVKMNYPDFRNLLIETAWQDGKNVPIIIEKAGQQGGYIDDLLSREELRGFTIIAQPVEKDKFTRAMPWVAAAEGGKVEIVRGQWNNAFLLECEAFTGDDSHAHDDQIDAVSAAYARLCKSENEMIDNPLMR